MSLAKITSTSLKYWLLLLLGLYIQYNTNFLWSQTNTCPEITDKFSNRIISGNIVKSTQTYRTTKDYTGKEVRLQADIYQVLDLKIQAYKNERPLIILYYGGGFKSGSRNTTIMQLLARYFAQRGFVAVSPDYRLGWNDWDKTPLCGGGTQSDYLDAQYRAMQDDRALVKHFKNQAKSIGFDTNRVFLFGISSGATLAVSRLEDRWIANDGKRKERLGSLEDEGTISSQVAGIISFEGANLRPDINSDFNTPVCFFHGTCDNAVPYHQQYLASCSNLGYYYGPDFLTKSLEASKVCYHNYIYCGFGHDLAAEGDPLRDIPWGLNDVLIRTINFMQEVMCNQCQTIEKVVNTDTDIRPIASCNPIASINKCDEVLKIPQNKISLAPNLFHHDYSIYIYTSFEEEKNLTLNIYNMSGSLIESKEIKVPKGKSVYQSEIAPLVKGVYLYQFVESNQIINSGKLWKL